MFTLGSTRLIFFSLSILKENISKLLRSVDFGSIQINNYLLNDDAEEVIGTRSSRKAPQSSHWSSQFCRHACAWHPADKDADDDDTMMKEGTFNNY